MTHGSPAMVLAKTHASQEEAVGHCSHLGIEEREDVMLLARQYKGVREIARTIGRDKPAVSRELARARQIQERLGIPACFCAPRYPWEKECQRAPAASSRRAGAWMARLMRR